MTITENEVILVDDWKFVERAVKVFASLNKANKRDLDNFLVWKFVREATPFMSRKFREVKLDYDRV